MSQSSHTAAVAVRGCLEVCHRCLDLVDQLESSPKDHDGHVYRLLGPHLRHCLDHFTQLLRGLPKGLVDYDARDRDLVTEREPDHFRSVLAGVIVQLQTLSSDDLTRPIRVMQQAAAKADPTPVDSTVERELLFLSSHTIHHLALILQLARANGVEVDEGLGVAFSTAAYHGSAEVASR